VIDIIRQHAALYHTSPESENAAEKNQLNPKRFFSFYRMIIARFAYDCPFNDVSSRFQELVLELNEKGIDDIPKAEYGFLNAPSRFFTPLGLEKIDSTEPVVEKHFKTFFLEDGM
jgi:hypothetical protein